MPGIYTLLYGAGTQTFLCLMFIRVTAILAQGQHVDKQIFLVKVFILEFLHTAISIYVAYCTIMVVSVLTSLEWDPPADDRGEMPTIYFSIAPSVHINFGS